MSGHQATHPTNQDRRGNRRRIALSIALVLGAVGALIGGGKPDDKKGGKSGKRKKGQTFTIGGVSNKQLCQFTRQFSTLQDAGLPVLRSLKILERRPRQRQLVGFALAKGYAGAMPKECHLIIDADQIAGRVTSVTFSPTLGQVIGLAFVSPDKALPGTAFRIRVDGGEMVPANVVATPFYDPQNLRQTRVPD